MQFLFWQISLWLTFWFGLNMTIRARLDPELVTENWLGVALLSVWHVWIIGWLWKWHANNNIGKTLSKWLEEQHAPIQELKGRVAELEREVAEAKRN